MVIANQRCTKTEYRMTLERVANTPTDLRAEWRVFCRQAADAERCEPRQPTVYNINIICTRKMLNCSYME